MMKISIRDAAPAIATTGTQRLAKPTIDLETALYGITLLRLSLGLLFVAHGLLKVFTFTLPGTAQFFTSVGLLGFMATPVALAEILGGGLLIGCFCDRLDSTSSTEFSTISLILF
jgi:putative oxidoreductase